jgi:hypothetical protein
MFAGTSGAYRAGRRREVESRDPATVLLPALQIAAFVVTYAQEMIRDRATSSVARLTNQESD